jgi:hypothetical protein
MKLAAIGRSTRRLAALEAAIVGAYGALAAAAAAPHAWFFLAMLAVTAALDELVTRVPRILPMLRTAQLGYSNRSMLRDACVLVLLTRTSWTSATAYTLVMLAAWAQPLARVTFLTVLIPLRRRLNSPIEVRNIDLSGLPLPRPGPAYLINESTPALHRIGLLPAAAAALAALSGAAALFVTVAALVVFVVLAATVTVLLRLLEFRHCLYGDRLLVALKARVEQLRPQVILHHSGPVTGTYQANMWLSTLDRLRRPTLIVLRERASLRQLGATGTPVLCVPRGVDLMNLELPDVRVALYTANVGKNIHYLRTPGVAHVFIGHGDSDKSASFNPFSKVYTQIWVAGPAGRDRYVRAHVGVRSEDIVEVGRPQLDAIEARPRHPVGVIHTVLYAPTWEGWISDPFLTSLTIAGPTLVKRLLAARPRVRVIYKPHPLTGSVSPAAARVHKQITALLTQENAERLVDPTLNGSPRNLGATIAPLPEDHGALRPADHAARYAQWSARYWACQPSWAHRVVVGPAPTLYDCFNTADLLVADISSVVSDFLASQKPYVVTNMAGVPDEEFRQRNPTAEVAYLLDAAGERMTAILETVRAGDPMAAARRTHKSHLLGPDRPPAIDRFAAAVDAAYAAAEAEVTSPA